MNKFHYQKGEHPLIGRRIMLIHTSDIYTDLKKGDLGTITDVNECELWSEKFTQIGIRWNNGSNLMLILGKDKFKVLDQMKERAHGYLSWETCEERRIKMLKIAKKPCTCKGKGNCISCMMRFKLSKYDEEYETR